MFDTFIASFKSYELCSTNCFICNVEKVDMNWLCEVIIYVIYFQFHMND